MISQTVSCYAHPMIAATHFLSDAFTAAPTKLAPDPRRWRPPLFIGDCATPFAGSTLLLAMIRTQNVDDDDPPAGRFFMRNIPPYN